jgi:DNA-binding NtrC family response regulator
MSPRILIVDDEANVRLNYRITLETEGYEVFEASTTASALQKLLERQFALAILDLRMPGMDGLELLAKMREVGITVPATIVTAYSDVPNAVKAMKLGAIDFFAKTSPARRSSPHRRRDLKASRTAKGAAGRNFQLAHRCGETLLKFAIVRAGEDSFGQGAGVKH